IRRTDSAPAGGDPEVELAVLEVLQCCGAAALIEARRDVGRREIRCRTPEDGSGVGRSPEACAADQGEGKGGEGSGLHAIGPRSGVCPATAAQAWCQPATVS